LIPVALSAPAQFQLPHTSAVSPSASSGSIYSSPGLGGPRSTLTESDSTFPTSPSWSTRGEILSEEQQTFVKEGWLPAPRVADEDDRRKALYRSKILQAESHKVLDKIVRLAQRTFNVLTVLIMMWYVARSGVALGMGSQRGSSGD
jgi:hypothetical protein